MYRDLKRDMCYLIYELESYILKMNLIIRIIGYSSLFNSFEPEFTIVIFIHYKPRIAAAIHDW